MSEFVRIGSNLQAAMLTIMRYVKDVTGIEPTDEEIVNSLKSYFILNEVGNQIKYQLKKNEANKETDPDEIKDLRWTLNLMTGPGQNILAKAGVFRKEITDAIQAIQDVIEKSSGTKPSHEIIAKSLRSSFILSEIKNQIDWQRKNAKGAKGLKKIS